MLAWEPVVEAKALRARGWTISAIARHLEINRRTVRNYLTDKTVPNQRHRAAPDRFAPFAEYARLRLVDDPHLWASALHDELVDLGYPGSYPAMTRALRARELRPHCEACDGVKGRDSAIIAHPTGEETQWDWLELPDPPGWWGWGKTAHLLVGSLAHSSRWRGVLAPGEDQPHLIEALDGVARRLGGLTRTWRFDRMATVCHPDSGRLSRTFGPVAGYYGVRIEICPPRRGNRKGVVEKANLSAAQRWWRTMADELSPARAQASLDQFCVRVGDARARRRGDGSRATVGELAAGEGLRPCPTGPYPAILTAEAKVSAQALVAFRGNRYSIGPGHAGATVVVSHRLGTATLEITTLRGVVLARHHRHPDSAGVVARLDEHVAALERSVLAAFTDRAPCRRKVRRPASAAARAEAQRLLGHNVDAPAREVVVDFAAYAAAAAERAQPTAPTGTDDGPEVTR